MATPKPGQVATNSLIPFGGQQLDQATWAYGAADMLIQGIVDQTRKNGGDSSKVGMPATWPYGPLPANSVHADGSVNPILISQVQQYVNSAAAQSDPDFNSFVGVNYSSAVPGGYQDVPLSPSEQLAREQFEYTKAQNALKLATGGGNSSATRVSASSLRAPSSGGGGGGSSSSSDEAFQQQKDLNQQEFELKKQLMLLQFQLDNDPNNPKLQLQRDQMAQELSMFQQSLAQKTQSEQESLRQQRAKTIADYSANPGDAVAREYFLRQQGDQPLGTPIDIFTGQQTGGGLTTLSELMRKQAPLVKPYLSAQVTGAPPPTNPPPEPTPTPEPPPEEVPQYAMGTSEITPDGWTRAPKFITGDHPAGLNNPEQVQLRVRNGQPEARVTPLSQMAGRGPRFALGTDPWGLKQPATDQGIDWGDGSTTQPQSASYTPSTAASPVYNSKTGHSNIDFSSPKTNPYAVAANSGVPYNASMIDADPYFGTQYQGMKPSDIVTNANSPFYGQTVESAQQAQLRQNAMGGPQQFGENSRLTVVGPTGGMTTGGWTGADPYAANGAVANSYLEQIYFDGDGYSGPINNVTRQADAGILTGAEMSRGATQSGNPGAAAYRPPEGWPTPPAGNLADDQLSRPAPTGGQAGGPTNEPTGDMNLAGDQVQNGQPVNDTNGVSTIPGSSVQARKINPQGFEEVLAPGSVQMNGATFDVKPGDYRTPQGTWLRFNPILNDYSPLLPSKVTEITSEDQFWKLPDAERQKILTGQETGYAMSESGPNQWRTGLLAGLGMPSGSGAVSKPDFMAMTDEQKRQLINNPISVMGSALPEQTYTPIDNGPMAGQLSSLISLRNPQGAMSGGQFNYADYFPPQLQNVRGQNTYLENPELTRIMAGDQSGAEWQRANALWEKMQAEKAAAANQPTTPPATGGGTTTPPPSSGGSTTTPPPATGGGTPGGGTTPPPATGGGTTTPPSTGNSLSDILAALSYGGDIYQNLPILRLLSGQMTQADYDTIANAPVEVPGLGVSLPSANQAANYATLAQLQQQNPDAFALLNSLYTAGNVPLSAIMAYAKSRAPLGSAYEGSLVQTT